MADFNPRSHEGSDGQAMDGLSETAAFQSTLPRRERREANLDEPAEEGISIHAPTKGATRKLRPMYLRIRNFNPRSHEGSDSNGSSGAQIYVNFNPRSHEGSDDAVFSKFDRVSNFNPRSHEGSDQSYRSKKDEIVISIHAPTKGATEDGGENHPKAHISIHAPTKGATFRIPTIHFDIMLFQSTLPRRERLLYKFLTFD